jgi:hypothetical protein
VVAEQFDFAQSGVAGSTIDIANQKTQSDRTPQRQSTRGQIGISQ